MCILRLFVYFDTSSRIEVFTFKVILTTYNCLHIPFDFSILEVDVLGKTLMGKTRRYTPSHQKRKKHAVGIDFFFYTVQMYFIQFDKDIGFFFMDMKRQIVDKCLYNTSGIPAESTSSTSVTFA